MKIPHYLLFPLLFITLFTGCRKEQNHEPDASSLGTIFSKKHTTGSEYDLDHILKGGELIVATLSGPKTYYEYHGLGMGQQYILAENFAESQGISIRVELAADTTELIAKLRDGQVDLIAYPLHPSTLREAHLVAAGYDKGGRWAVRSNTPQLAEALDDWYVGASELDPAQLVARREKDAHHVIRRAQSVYLSRERGVISNYDKLFQDASAVTGWDWRLIAAQCYQESAFDPNARSYVGARGLMQLMPKTAESLGLSPEEVTMPEKNVAAAARYIAKLSQRFSDISNPDERVKFVLAAYNGGSAHIRDAMALARKYGHNPQRWDDVSPYVLGLSQPKYYKDPVVKYGYMIGSETAGYVYHILQRWHDYGGKVAVIEAPHLPDQSPAAPAPSNRDDDRRSYKYASKTKVMTPDDPEFNQMGVE